MISGMRNKNLIISIRSNARKTHRAFFVRYKLEKEKIIK